MDTLTTLINTAKNLAKEGKSDEARELNSIVRKHMSKLNSKTDNRR